MNLKYSDMLKQLDTIVLDCKGTLRSLGCELRFKRDDSVFVLQSKSKHHGWLDTDYFVSVNHLPKARKTPFMVERGSVIKGCYRTRNGDGWPDDYDMVAIGNFPSLAEAFTFIVGELVKGMIDCALENAAEHRLWRESESVSVSE